MNDQYEHGAIMSSITRSYALTGNDKGVLLAMLLAGLAGVPQTTDAAMISNTTEISKYLVIGTGEGSSGNEFASFQMSDSEIGADQEVVSTSGNGSPSQRTGSLPNGSTPNLFDVFLGTQGANASSGGNRWNDTDPNWPNDTVGVADTLPGARPLFEGIDWSGNVALTGEFAKFESSNSDVHADLGIQCNRTPAGCFPNPSSPNSFFDEADPLVEQNLNNLNGISQFDPTDLIDELLLTRDYIVGLQADTTFTSTPTFTTTPDFVNQNIKDAGAPAITDLDAIDAAGNSDGIAVIDIDVDGNKFELNNTDWILQSTQDTLVIFRMKDGVQFDFANSSIMLGDGNNNSTDVIDDLGAIFFMDAYKGTNELFNLNNVILGGVALWDFTDLNPNRSTLLSTAPSTFNPAGSGDRTLINAGQNAQGCSQFISNQVLMSNTRWNRCFQAETQVSEPGTLFLLAFGLSGWPLMRAFRRRQKC